MGLVALLGGFALILGSLPNALGHPDNYVPANGLVTPAHIVPEWYFLPFYAVLRSVPSKLGGVVLMVLAIAVLALLPLVGSVGSLDGHLPYSRVQLPCLAGLFVALGLLGGLPVAWPFVGLGRALVLLYFVLLLGVLPISHALGAGATCRPALNGGDGQGPSASAVRSSTPFCGVTKSLKPGENRRGVRFGQRSLVRQCPPRVRGGP